MEKIYKLFFLLLLCALVSCDDDDDTPIPGANNNAPDTEKPKVQLLSPASNTTHLVIDLVSIRAKLSDNDALGNIRAFLVDANENQRNIVEPLIFPADMKFSEFGGTFYPRDVAPGTYMLVLEVKDRHNNVAKDSVILTIHAPDIDKTEFVKAFEKGNFYRFLDWGWFPVDFTNGIQFNETQLSNGLYMMLSLDDNIKKDEWERFVKDFRFEKQNWATWDADTNGDLDYDEFHKGISKLGLFKKWNLDNSQLVSEAEFAMGIFDSWDRNRDNLLSKDEYFDTFFTYLALRY